MNNTDKYREYIAKRGKLVNQEIKNNIYTSGDWMTRIMLVHYVLETLENFDYRVCPDYIDKRTPLVPESVFYILATEDLLCNILTEDEGSLVVAENSNINLLQDILTAEDDIHYMASEGDLEKLLFDRSKIENYLTNLTKDISC